MKLLITSLMPYTLKAEDVAKIYEYKPTVIYIDVNLIKANTGNAQPFELSMIKAGLQVGAIDLTIPGAARSICVDRVVLFTGPYCEALKRFSKELVVITQNLSTLPLTKPLLKAVR